MMTSVRSAECGVRSERTKCRLAEYYSFFSLFVSQESNSTQNGNTIYREGAKNAKDIKNKGNFFLQQGLQYFLSDLRAFAVPGSRSGLSGLGIRRE